MTGEYRIFDTPPGDTGLPLTVVIADDQALVRGGFRLILKAAGINVARRRRTARRRSPRSSSTGRTWCSWTCGCR